MHTPIARMDNVMQIRPKLKPKSNLLIVLSASLAISACGGGGGGGSDGPASTPNQPQGPIQLGGIWEGDIAVGGDRTSGVGLTTEDGELRFLNGYGEQFVGNFQVTGNSFNADMMIYAPYGEYYIDGTTSAEINASGSFASRSYFEGTSTAPGFVPSTFTYTYDTAYERGSSYEAVAGDYAYLDNPDYAVELSINNSGQMRGSTSYGCTFDGEVAPINTEYNMYRLYFTISNCLSEDGFYTGLMALRDKDGGFNNELLFSADGPLWIYSGFLERQGADLTPELPPVLEPDPGSGEVHEGDLEITEAHTIDYTVTGNTTATAHVTVVDGADIRALNIETYDGKATISGGSISSITAKNNLGPSLIEGGQIGFVGGRSLAADWSEFVITGGHFLGYISVYVTDHPSLNPDLLKSVHIQGGQFDSYFRHPSLYSQNHPSIFFYGDLTLDGPYLQSQQEETDENFNYYEYSSRVTGILQDGTPIDAEIRCTYQVEDLEPGETPVLPIIGEPCENVVIVRE
jgi:hypothetical protein